MSIKEVIMRSEAELQDKQEAKDEKESNTVLQKGQQLVLRYVETVDHSVVTGRYNQLYIEDENEDDGGGPDEDFENLEALELPPDVEVEV